MKKDAWVTLVLRLIFNAEISKQLVFKGGTSLSKAYKLIKRFSEDIDLAVNREYLGFAGELDEISTTEKYLVHCAKNNYTYILVLFYLYFVEEPRK